MPSPRLPALRRGEHVHVRLPRADDAKPFLAAVRASRALHDGWVSPPATRAGFDAYVARFRPPTRGRAEARHAGIIVARNADGALAGVFNFSEIVRGAFQSAYLGYYAFSPLAGRGYMREGLALALEYAFGTLKLHRVEVNIQPSNARSLALVERVGFAREGYSRRYVKIRGRWRDHVRYALLVEDWRAARRRASRAQEDAR